MRTYSDNSRESFDQQCLASGSPVYQQKDGEKRSQKNPQQDI